MKPRTRSSLFNETIFYFAGLVAVFGSLYFGVQYVAADVQEYTSAPLEREMTKLDLMVNNAREIREAIANANHAVEPLPAITAKPARHVSPSSKPDKLNNEARNAFAAAPYKKQTASTAVYDRHTVQ
jgi:hypothetical protein